MVECPLFSDIVPHMETKQLNKLLIPAAAALILLFFAYGYDASRVKQPIAGNSAPELDFAFYDGYEWDTQTEAQLSDFEGQIVVLNFWASWCLPCQAEAALLEQTWQNYADDEVVLLGVAWSDTDRKAYEFLTEYGITYPNAPDLGLNAEETYQFTGIPETFFIDRDGVIYFHQPGPINERMMTQTLDEMLAE